MPIAKAVTSKQIQKAGKILKKRCHKYRTGEFRKALPAIKNPLIPKKP
jgi:hypothetical protein